MQSFCKAAFLILFTLLLPVGMTAQNPIGGSNWKETKVTLRVSDEPLGFVRVSRKTQLQPSLLMHIIS